MAELMRRIFALLGLMLALSGAGVRPVEAYPAQRAAAFSAACARGAIYLDFSSNPSSGRYCLWGVLHNSLSTVPGYSFSRPSSETCIWADGHLTTAGPDILCLTDLGIGLWESRTNSFLNSAVGTTQTITTTAASWTLSFYGTGSIVMTGTCSGTLAGTGASVRVSTTITAAAGSCTLTVTGSTTDVQMEAGTFATPWISTTASATTRAADSLTITNAALAGQNVSFWGQVYRTVLPSSFATIVDQGLNKSGIRITNASQLDPIINGVGDVSVVGNLGLGPSKFAASFSNGRQIAAVAGALGSPGSATWSQGTGTTLFIGRSQSNIQLLNGYLASLFMVSDTLPDVQVQRLSQ